MLADRAMGENWAEAALLAITRGIYANETGVARVYYMGGNGPHGGARNSSFALATLRPDGKRRATCLTLSGNLN